jgi:hypothetical protein
MTANIDYYHSLYVAQTNNPHGWVRPYSDYGTVDIYFEASWMQDFFTASIGMSRALGLPLTSTTSTKLAEFFAWKANSIVGRFGGTGTDEYLYRDAAPYVIAIAPSDTPDFVTGTGPWYTNWGDAYTDTPHESAGDRIEGDLRGSYFPDPTSYWGNLQPALAYAVRFGVTGADAAYARMTGASNWYLFDDAADAQPVWGVEPAYFPETRYARPDADITDGAWLPSTGSDLYSMLDEVTYDDTDYIYTASASTCEIRLSDPTDPGTSNGQILRYRAKSEDTSTLVAKLMQGSTTIATRTHTSVPGTWTEYTMTLTSGECDAITDYTDLRVKLEAE